MNAHMSAVGGPIWTKLGSNSMHITSKWSRSKPDVEFQMADVCFSKPEVVIAQPKCREIWFADSHWPSEDTDINKWETGTRIKQPRPPSWKIHMTSCFRIGWYDMDKVWQLCAEYHADYGDMVEVETGRRISIWWTCFFQTGNSYISAVNWVILTKCGTLIDIDLLKKATSPNPKPEVKLRHSGHHLENRYDIITPPSMVQFG